MARGNVSLEKLMARCATRIAVLTTLLLGCGSAEDARPYVFLRVEDPNGIAASGAGEPPALELIDASGNASRFDDLPGAFPLTVTLTSERRGPQPVTVDLYRATTLVGRGMVTIDVLAQNKQEASVTLEQICFFSAAGCPPIEQVPEEPPEDPMQPECDEAADCDDGLFCNGAETCADGVCNNGTPPCAPESCDQTAGCEPREAPCITTNPNGVELEPDGAACASDGGDAGVCYAGECVDPSYIPACDSYLSLDFFAEGQLLGGAGHGITINQLQFPQTDSQSYNPQWVVQDDDLRPGDPVPAKMGYTIYVLAPYHLASFRIRTQAGVRCQLATEPSASATTVSDTAFATVRLGPGSVSDGVQKIRFDFDCGLGGLAGLRIDDFCLIEQAD